MDSLVVYRYESVHRFDRVKRPGLISDWVDIKVNINEYNKSELLSENKYVPAGT